MNSKTYNPQPLFSNYSQNDIVQDASRTYNLGLDQFVLQCQGELQCDPSIAPNVSYINEPTGNRILTNVEPQTNLNFGMQTGNYVTDTSYQHFSDTSFKEEFMSQKILFHQLENLIHHDMGDTDFNCDVLHPVLPSSAPISGVEPVMGMSSSGLYISQNLQTRADCVKIADPGYGTLRTNSVSDPHSSIGLPCNETMATSVSFGGNKVVSHMGAKQVTSDFMPSPEPISSLTACSDVDWQSDNVDGGNTFSSSSQYISEFPSENFIQRKHDDFGESNLIGGESFINNQFGYHVDGLLLSEANMELTHPNAWVSEQLGPQQFHHQPHIMQSDGQSEVKVQPQGCLIGCNEGYDHITNHLALEMHRFPLELGNGVQPHNSCEVKYASEGSGINFGLDKALKRNDSDIFSLRDFRLLFMKYKKMPLNVGGGQVPFLSYLHLTTCTGNKCRCDQYRLLIPHLDKCDNSNVSVWGPASALYSASGRCKDNFSQALSDGDSSVTQPSAEGEFLRPPKRMRINNILQSQDGPSTAITPTMDQPHPIDRYSHLKRWPQGSIGRKEVNVMMNETQFLSEKSKRADVTINHGTVNSHTLEYINVPFLAGEVKDGCKLEEAGRLSATKLKNDLTSVTNGLTCESTQILYKKHPGSIVEEEMKLVPNSDNSKSEATGYCIEHSVDIQQETGMEDPKEAGVPLVDLLTAEQIKQHISSLNQRITKFDESSASNGVVHSESTCQLCDMDKLVFNPPSVYCSYCCARIKRNAIYYWTLDGMAGRYCFCTRCFRASRGGSISFQGLSFCKEKLQKEMNNEENEESWVQCDKCEGWQHQICGLYNAKNDLQGEAKYICPYCRLQEIKIGAHVPPSSTFGAKDLPRTKLSDHIEQRLFRRLKEERTERAMSLGKNFDEVPGAADLVVRVVLSIQKPLKVKQQFLDIFHGKDYPGEFLYRSKVILLFQKIGGVDVCLFGMYVQEFGSGCPPPNHRTIYISYLDSVKYFQPQIETVTGEALRTFVYHEILIGYLDYCKRRGFTTCYIWACPPLKGEDYILSCHPETQKTPKADKLRQWYKSMLQKAAKEDVVVNYTNLYDQFFIPNDQCSIKVTAARLPYFEGNYWSGAAEDMIRKIGEESGGSDKRSKKLLTKRSLKAMGHTDLSTEAVTDIFVMQKLGQAILPVKEDFIIVNLQLTCTNCHEVILSRSHWLCRQCQNFHICPRCVDMEQNFNGRIHISVSGEKHTLTEIAADDVTDDTEDKDVILDNDIFENRHSFLSFCQENHYQFDSLRRAKHSSMMILYHLHKQTLLTMVIQCSICKEDAIVDEGWLCETCPEFYVCNLCYQRDGGHPHIHKLRQHSSIAEWGTRIEAQKQRAAKEKELLEVILHAIHCRSTKDNPCTNSKCPRMRKIFLHPSQCNIRHAGNCIWCRRLWALLQLHSRNCRDSCCQVPHCMDIKKRAELRAIQFDSRRRAAVEGLVAD